MNRTEKEWEAESDARTLIDAHKIRTDSKRFARAKKALTRLEKEAERTKLEAQVTKKLSKAITSD